MYTRVGEYPQARQLMQLVAGLEMTSRPSGYVITEIKQTIRAFRPLLSSVFPGEWTNARLAILNPTGTIPLHRDAQDGSGSYRRLLVMRTNPDAWTLHDGSWQHLEEDGIYEVKPELSHAAVNWGTEVRVHLIVDTR